jgi:lipoprotein-releasing system permease protein
MPYELFIALRYLRAKRKQVMISVITVIAISAVAAGVASLILVLGMMTGFREDFQTKILSGTQDMNLLRKDGRPLEDYRELEHRLQSFPHISAAAATLYQKVLITGKQDTSGAELKGVDLAAPRAASEVFQFTSQGDPDMLGEPETDPDTGAKIDRIIVGRDLAESVGLGMGDVATVISPQGHLTPVGMAPRYRDFRVAGIFESGLAEYDSTWAYISLEAAQRLSGKEDVADLIQIKVDDLYAVKDIGHSLIAALGDDYAVRDWQELNAPIYTALSYEKLLSSIALLIVIGIAALNIITVLVMMVMEKQRDVAILKSIGATNRSVMSLFMAEGLLIGFVGIVVGVLLGAGLCYFANSRQLIKLPPGAYALSFLPFHAHFTDIAMVAVVTIVISFLSTIYPSWTAARLDPVEALRYE